MPLLYHCETMENGLVSKDWLHRPSRNTTSSTIFSIKKIFPKQRLTAYEQDLSMKPLLRIMNVFRAQSTSEQLANFLKKEIYHGRMKGLMPGVKQLVKELGVSTSAVCDAMALLENHGYLVSRGARKRAMITVPPSSNKSYRLRIQILLYDKRFRISDYLVELKHELSIAGHQVDFFKKTLLDLQMDPVLIQKQVEENPADAWIVVTGSQAVLRWFASQTTPAFAIFGLTKGINIAGAGPQKSTLMESIVKRLTKLGHQRIVMLCRQEARKPKLGDVAKAFLNALESHGIIAGPYHLPNWGDTREEFHQGLDQLFQLTPPTALICSYPLLYAAAQTHLAKRGIIVPRDLSMICLEIDPLFSWCDPPIAHVSWDSRPLIRRVVRWAANVAAGKVDTRSEYIPTKFIEGGSIGKAPE